MGADAVKRPGRKHGAAAAVHHSIALWLSMPVALAAHYFDPRREIGSIVSFLDAKGLQDLIVPSVAVCILHALCSLVSTYADHIFEQAMPRTQKNHLYSSIRGVWYDLAEFDHPGGPVALALAENRDATALFESHHYLIPHERLMAILRKYRVPDSEAAGLATLESKMKGVAPYIWEKYEEDPFVKDVKQMVVDHFTPIARRRGISLRAATKATPERWCMVLGLMVLFFATVPYFVAGSWWALLVTPALAWITLCNYWHDCLHFSMSTDWRVNAILPYLFPWLSSPWMWYHQHVIGHHAYTNVPHMDPDIAHTPHYIRQHESIKWKAVHQTQHTVPHHSAVMSVAVGLGMQLWNDVRANMKGHYNSSVPCCEMRLGRYIAHVVGRMFYVVCVFVWPFAAFPFGKAMVWAVVPITIFSWMFMINTQINHLTPGTANASDTNFLKHQVVTGQDFGTNSLFCRYFSGGLNQQIEHHMFPCVNHCHLADLAPKVKAICAMHGVRYNEVSGYGEALNLHLEHNRALGIPPFCDPH